MNKKLVKQIAAIVGVAAIFAFIDIGVYSTLVMRNISRHSPGMQKMSVETKDYVPFADGSYIKSVDTDMKISENIPVLDGAAALLPVYAGFVESVYPESAVAFNGSDYAPDSKMQYTNTRGAFKNIVDGKADIIICAQPSDKQLEYAHENGVELELVPIGTDAFVFIVNANNPVSGLTIDQIKDIYSGKIRRWSEVGGSNHLISALTRNEGSGSQTTFQKLMGDTPIAKDYDIFAGSPIGFSFRYYVTGMLEEGGIKMLAINGVDPTPENIANGSYPIGGDFYAIYRKGESNPNVTKFIDWMQSEEGQKIVADTGYIPLG